MEDFIQFEWDKHTGVLPEKDSKAKPEPTPEDIERYVKEGQLLP
jgi:hypothetical protein